MYNDHLGRKSAFACLCLLLTTLTGCATVSGQNRIVNEEISAQKTMITASDFASEDTLFTKPYIDVQEWRDLPVRHYYIHGGFEDSDTRFSYYLPPKEQYKGRFFQHVTPVPGSENLAQKMPAGSFNKIGFSIDSGAYFVETNGGGVIDLTKGSQALADPTITAYRANAAAARFSRNVAAQLYGTEKRPYGYIYGGSGGAFRTIGGLESTTGVWDGGVPYVNGSSMAIPNLFSIRMQALRVLRDKFDSIVDAADPGGSGKPYAGLSEYEASVLREADKMGFPMQSWFGYRTMGLHGFAALYGGVSAADPSYFTDFWTKPGYLGHDKPELFAKDRVQHVSKVAALITAEEAAKAGAAANPFSEANRGGVDTAFILAPGEDGSRIVGIRLADAPPPVYFLGGELGVQSGALQGQRIFLSRITEGVLMFGVVNPAQIAKLKVGDEVRIDNSNFLAMESYHRHQVPGPDYPVWDQFRDKEGKPIYPQRPMLLGPLFMSNTSGSMMTGKVAGKVILVSSLWDREALPWQADWYRKRVEAQSGDGAVRLFYTDHALHGDEQASDDPSRIVSYQGMLQQALRDLAAWVEDGKAPPASTVYTIADGQVRVPEKASERLGIQPVVSLTVNGKARADVKVGEVIRLSGLISAPPAAGHVVSASWDFFGKGGFPITATIPSEQREVTVSAEHSFESPGTYFIALRGVTQRAGDAKTPYARLLNLARVRVVVTK